jgi:hypothetical protein
MVRNAPNGSAMIENWLRNKNTIEFLGIWEQLNNPQDFNSLEFEGIMRQAGLNRFTLSVKQWVKLTGAVGLVAKAGRYGGTYAHRDIAFEFGAWISPLFKLMLIKEFQRLKEEEQKRLDQQWDFRRLLSKVNYDIHTDSIREHIIPRLRIPKHEEWVIFASEADILNLALFGQTAKQWREAHPGEAKAGRNMRDFASIQQLTVLANLESLNARLIHDGLTKDARLMVLRETAQSQLAILARNPRLQELSQREQLPGIPDADFEANLRKVSRIKDKDE